MTRITVTCPLCRTRHQIDQPDGYGPVFHDCRKGKGRFIVERTSKGYDVLAEVGAPCCSNPDCRCVEMSAGDD